MKIFRKSLSNELVSTASATFLILLGIVIAQRTGNLIRLAAKGILPNDAIGTVLGFSMVRYLPMVLSLSIFLAVLLTLSRWHRDSEMAVWFSAGLGIRSWIRPILGFVLPIVLVISLLSLLVMPWATQKAEDYREQLKNRDELATISPGVFKESRNGQRIYYVENFNELGLKVNNIFVQTIQNQNTGIVTAQTGKRETTKNGDNFLVLEKGRRYEGKPNTAEVSTTEFERYALRIETKEMIPEPITTPAKPTLDLIKDASNSDKAELQWRMAIPISAIILALLAVPLSFVDPRAGRSLNLMFALLIYIVYINMLSIFQAWITQGRIHSMLGLWPVHATFALLTAYMFYRRNQLKPLFPNPFASFWQNKTVKSAAK